MLSHHDRTELEKIERWFEDSDPELAAALRAGRRPSQGRLRTALLILLDAFTVLLLVTGIVADSPALTLCAFAAAAGAVWAHLARRNGRKR